jgi:hypothetical protein
VLNRSSRRTLCPAAISRSSSQPGTYRRGFSCLRTGGSKIDGMPDQTPKRLFERRPSKSDQLQVAAKKWARSEVDDTDAAAALANETRGFAAKLLDAEIHDWPHRDDFVNDRAYRLLVGVRDGSVPPMNPSRHERFAREEELGCLPLSEAFERLAASYPELNAFETRARDGEKLSLRQRPMLRRALGEQDGHRQTDTDFRIAWIYLRAVARGEDTEASLFDRPGYRAHGRFNRAAKLRAVSVTCAFGFGFIWSLVHGNIIGAIIIGIVSIPVLTVWLITLYLFVTQARRKRNDGRTESAPSRVSP